MLGQSLLDDLFLSRERLVTKPRIVKLLFDVSQLFNNSDFAFAGVHIQELVASLSFFNLLAFGSSLRHLISVFEHVSVLLVEPRQLFSLVEHVDLNIASRLAGSVALKDSGGYKPHGD